jgi:glycosyltransferase involved in cell wall biosynthesis
MPFFSFCIPNYNRTDFLLQTLKSIAEQTFIDYEVCISDGKSTDERFSEIRNFIELSKIPHCLYESPINLQYDPNLRSAISRSSGEYLILMGNDDALSTPDTTTHIHKVITDHPNTGVLITNYRELSSGRTFNRMKFTGPLGKGPSIAATTFRDYSFISGIVMHGPSARALATDLCDGGEMYQMYLGAAIITSGKELTGTQEVCIDKDIQIQGLQVETIKTRPKLTPRWSDRPNLPMMRIFDTVSVGIESVLPEKKLGKYYVAILNQLYSFTYPYWVLQYKHLQSFKYTLLFLYCLRPSKLLRNRRLTVLELFHVWAIYLFTGTIALMTPIKLFKAMEPVLYRIAKYKQGIKSI